MGIGYEKHDVNHIYHNPFQMKHQPETIGVGVGIGIGVGF